MRRGWKMCCELGLPVTNGRDCLRGPRVKRGNKELVQCVDRRWWMRNVCQGRSFFLSHFDVALYSRIRRSWELYCDTVHHKPSVSQSYRMPVIYCDVLLAEREATVASGPIPGVMSITARGNASTEAEDIANIRRCYRLEAVRRRTRLALQISVPRVQIDTKFFDLPDLSFITDFSVDQCFVILIPREFSLCRSSRCEDASFSKGGMMEHVTTLEFCVIVCLRKWNPASSPEITIQQL